MSGSSNRWQLYDLVHILGYHKMPTSDDELDDGLAEAVVWLRRHAPQSKCLERLEGARCRRWPPHVTISTRSNDSSPVSLAPSRATTASRAPSKTS